MRLPLSSLVNCRPVAYCTGLFVTYSLPDDQVRRLQLIQNTAARLVTRTRKHKHITPVLRRLHWLPVRERIDYKILLLAFKGLRGLAPRYLAELLVQNRPHKALRSTSANKLVVPRTFLKTCGDGAFCYTAPKLWNSLPLHLRLCDSLVSFKVGLKLSFLSVLSGYEIIWLLCEALWADLSGLWYGAIEDFYFYYYYYYYYYNYIVRNIDFWDGVLFAYQNGMATSAVGSKTLAIFL